MESLQQEETVTPDVKTDVVERFEKKLRKTKTKSRKKSVKCSKSKTFWKINKEDRKEFV